MIQHCVDWIVYYLMKIPAESSIGQAVNFFLYDSVKIMLLLLVISFMMGIVNAYFPIDRLRTYLQKHKLFGLQYFLASLFGAVTPFCSCSSIPLFIGMVKGGIPLGVTFSFLITSPLVNEVAVAMFLGTFGLKPTLIYLFSGIMLGTIGGMVLGRFRLERFLSDWVINLQKQSIAETQKWQSEKSSFLQRLPSIANESWRTIKGVLLYVLIGVSIGAAMHGFVPEGFFEHTLSAVHWYSVPLAVILAVPMYANAASVVPIVEVFVQKGVALGTAIAFMMATVGLSIPEATMLKKVMKWKLVGIFFLAVTLFIILSGWIFNAIL